MNKQIQIIALAISLNTIFSVNAFAANEVPEACQKIKDLSQEQIDNMSYSEFSEMKSACLAADFMQQMNNSWDELVGDETEKDQQKSCIDEFNSINFDVLTFDPTSLLESAYASVMDQMDSFACTAMKATQAQIKTLSVSKELPYGLGSIKASPDYAEKDEIIKIDQKLSNEEIQDSINESIWGDNVPPVPSNKKFNYKRVGDILGQDTVDKTPKSDEAVKKVRLKLKDFGFSKSSEGDK